MGAPGGSRLSACATIRGAASTGLDRRSGAASSGARSAEPIRRSGRRRHVSASGASSLRMTYVRKFLWAGLVGPPLFIVVFLIEGLTRPGYSAWRHYVSQLATGPGGWVQVVNFLVFGTVVIAFAVGLRARTHSIAAPILLGLFGAGLIVAGVF